MDEKIRKVVTKEEFYQTLDKIVEINNTINYTGIKKEDRTVGILSHWPDDEDLWGTLLSVQENGTFLLEEKTQKYGYVIAWGVYGRVGEDYVQLKFPNVKLHNYFTCKKENITDLNHIHEGDDNYEPMDVGNVLEDYLNILEIRELSYTWVEK
jgi:hypothetical protein